jgi:hypothetical protein
MCPIAEETVAVAFGHVAWEIMKVELPTVNPDYILNVGKHFDLISELIETRALLFSCTRRLSEDELFELVTTATSEVNQIAMEFVKRLRPFLDTREPVLETTDRQGAARPSTAYYHFNV